MSLYDKNHENKKKIRQKMLIKARFTHYHPALETEKELTPWDEDDLFVKVPKNPLSRSLKYLTSNKKFRKIEFRLITSLKLVSKISFFKI